MRERALRCHCAAIHNARFLSNMVWEQFWISRIRDCKSKNVLFVCGDDDLDFFAEKLIAAGFDVRRGRRWHITEHEQRIIDEHICDA